MSENRPTGVHSTSAVHSRAEPAGHARPPRTDDGEPVGPYVGAPTPIPVQVLVRGQQLTGEVLGWRGDRVYVRYRTEMGSHLGWVPAADVDRVEASGIGFVGSGDRPV